MGAGPTATVGFLVDGKFVPVQAGVNPLPVSVVPYLTSITGYDAGATQTLKNLAGVPTWVTD